MVSADSVVRTEALRQGSAADSRDMGSGVDSEGSRPHSRKEQASVY